ncbi:MAG: glucose-6-phosphate dehydrogenase [Candidatus Scalindua sp. AMX11]|nr:MAG: glucose-6-phosphate dehydrogenase [Candidatus Scalindua sp.]NOG82516.1 glucose-6-phosphate dehydrogenase [Planctomycetota bacterium]RZV93946.1 MAG: glucose-6-phosphate dehydrogenase [Candidatus Scalindua sp. SCAELEC01]TDE65566.1 MAG: glucose-6-phosphate dehydrogenase [Candidatus Scalindua sp. AMX11]GJQ58151.1 MAG: glucose-6-phosphate 1-dehydrogenase [Candidatus Scalindua sp.]
MEISESTIIVIFGASGDLAKRKLMPALFQLTQDALLPNKTRIVGFARRAKTHEEFRSEIQEALVKFARSKPREGIAELKEFTSRLYYQVGNYDDKESFDELKILLDDIDGECGIPPGRGNRLFYISTPPDVFTDIVTVLGQADHIANPEDEDRWTRVIIEKPFGRDLETARALNKKVLAMFDESQVYRIDHYLGKETVQNIMAFRFGNSIFEPLWNRGFVSHIHINVAEAVSVEGRGGYYDHSGALRDMVQNHMLQLLALVAMEPPASFAPNSVRDEKLKVLSAIPPIGGMDVGHSTVRGQYAAGTIDGRAITDYLNEPGVSDDSVTETFVALKLYVDNWRWAGVPFYLRTGKALSSRFTEINIEFRQPPLALFSHSVNNVLKGAGKMQPNILSLRVQPNEGIRLSIGMKVPGPKMVLQPTDMEFCYDEVFDTEPPAAYERLILDAMSGDSTLFIRQDEVDAAWTLIDGILDGWRNEETPHIHLYRAGTWGPYAADEFIAQDIKKMGAV